MTRDAPERRGPRAARADARGRRLADLAFEGLACCVGGVVVDCNARFAELFGWSVADVPGQPATAFADPRSARCLQRQLASGSAAPCDLVGRRKDGTSIDVEVQARGGMLGARRVRVLGVRPIAARQRGAQALLESEERFRSLAHAAWEGIGFTSQGVIVDANPQLAALLGYEPHELIGKAVLDLVAPDSQATVLRALRTGSTERHEYQAVRKDGALITVEARGQVVPYRGGMIRMTAIRDITDRSRADLRRRALVAGTAGVSGEHFFRSLVKHLSRAAGARVSFVGEIVPDQPARMRTLSAWAGDAPLAPFEFALEGTPTAEVLAHGLRVIDGGVPDLFPGDRALAAWRATSYAGIALRDRAGVTLGVLAMAHDGPLQLDDHLVSMLRVFGARAGVEIERIRAEADVRRLNQGLEARVAHRTRELEAANRELEAFSYSVSHDLRAPLCQVMGFAGLLEREAGPALNDAAREHLADIVDAARKMAGLIDALLEFSRVGRVPLRKTGVDLANVARDVVADLTRAAEGRSIEWLVHPLPRVRGDARLLRQVLYNLLSNALKYTRPRAPARIEVGTLTSEEPGGVACYVRDNGVGFDQRRVHKLFGVFQRLHASSQFEGHGIGLANVQRVIHRHGGRVWATGSVEGGATFVFWLPDTEAGAGACGKAAS